ncbi:hypothetical protein PoB_005009200 [Plakobranchus ocellatus]|uniref:Uncharacterized protein n=1 Tax=Plakobranchus ocellatus TaxID=259542 RepID=A0AAV4BWS9_9GAST|nr:hypothetical protein PoB_005009200 [Plakobranchus ocellatus]
MLRSVLLTKSQPHKRFQGEKIHTHLQTRESAKWKPRKNGRKEKIREVNVGTTRRGATSREIKPMVGFEAEQASAIQACPNSQKRAAIIALRERGALRVWVNLGDSTQQNHAQLTNNRLGYELRLHAWGCVHQRQPRQAK